LIVASVFRAGIIQGRERGRLVIDPYMIHLSAYFLVTLYYTVRRSRKTAATAESMPVILDTHKPG
jgi:hypothetical protein